MNKLKEPLQVTAEESEIKLLQYLEKYLNSSKAELHKWIRTGQIRVNGARAKPFQLLLEKDLIRIPPFASYKQDYEENNSASNQIIKDNIALKSKELANSTKEAIKTKEFSRTCTLKVIATFEDCIVIDKPAGLAVQNGSGIKDSVAERLKLSSKGCNFTPAPVHRLDKSTSGALVIGTTQKGLRNLSKQFATFGSVQKEYLAVVEGKLDNNFIVAMQDDIEKKTLKNYDENICLNKKTLYLEYENDFFRPSSSLLFSKLLSHVDASTSNSLAFAKAITYFNSYPSNNIWGAINLQSSTQSFCEAKYTLVWLLLVTGKKHQLRLQLSSRGLPVVGDFKYSKDPLKSSSPLFLHSYAIKINNQRIAIKPSWLDAKLYSLYFKE